jgi:thioredoxin-dependent peroxiredoxin
MKYLLVCISVFFFSCHANSQEKHLGVGDVMPAFSLIDQNGNNFDSKDYVGKKIMVIYFYPKDESPVCTKESCSFRDSYSDFEKAGAIVVGINPGSVQSHKSFQENHQLPFFLLSDSANQVQKLFGVKEKFGMTDRETFVVDLNGKIVYSFDSFMKGTAHAENALNFVKKISNSGQR